MHDAIGKIIPSGAPLGAVLHRLSHNKVAIIGLAIIICLLIVAVLGPAIAPHNPISQDLSLRLLDPSLQFPLGTDELGRCVLSRIIYGARTSLITAVIIVGAATVIGLLLGLVAGYFGGLIDEATMRVVDIMLAFPGIIFAMVIVGILGPSLLNVMVGLLLVHWTGYARLMRGSVLSVKEQTFVEAARAIGASPARIMFRHILPNCLAPIVVMATLGMGHIILAAAALSFLGLGAQPPSPEWGAMLNSGRLFMRSYPYLMTFPGLAIMVTVLGFNLLGDGIRDALDIRQQIVKTQTYEHSHT